MKIFYIKIISPHDKEIAKAIEKNLKPLHSSWDLDGIDSHGLRKEPFDDVYKSYFDDLKLLSFQRYIY